MVPVALEHAAHGAAHRCIVVDDQDARHAVLCSVALRVDRAIDLVEVAEHDLQPAARLVPGVEHVAGVAPVADGVLVIHDLERPKSLTRLATGDDAVRWLVRQPDARGASPAVRRMACPRWR